MSYLDNNGLKKYTDALLSYISNNARLSNVVRSFNGRKGEVTAMEGDYSPEMVGAVPIYRMVNGKTLNKDITITAEDIGVEPVDTTNFVPSTRMVNGKVLSDDIIITAEDIGIDTANMDLDLYATKESPVFTGSISMGRYTGSDPDIEPDPDPEPMIVNEFESEQSDIKVGICSVALGKDVKATGDYSFAEGLGVTSEGYSSHAEGVSSKATGDYSHAEGNNTETIGSNSHAEGVRTYASGEASHSEGSNTIASGINSHAEGVMSIASGEYSHAEGNETTASGESAHAEGSSTVASGEYSHTEGFATESSGRSSHAEGNFTEASGKYSHAEGGSSKASGDYSHAENLSVCSNFAAHSGGKYNKPMTPGADLYNTVGDVFIIGNGSSITSTSNALRLAYEGTLYLTKAYNSTGADYAEYFEWLDGNPNNEDRVGRFVTLEGNKIKLAQEGDYILGVISGQPCVIGNADEDWLGRWEHDDFNRFVKEYLVHTETEVFPPDDVANDEALQQWLIQNDIQERDGHYFKMEVEVVDYPTDSWRHKANPSYDPSQSYIERKDRQEWDAVGMVGVLSVIDDGTCEVNGYAKVGPNGVATNVIESEKSWRVIQRVTDNIVKIIFK